MKKINRRSRVARRRIPYLVCRSLPNGVVTHLEARLLRDLVNREIHPIRCAASCKRKYQKAIYIADLCVETGHFWWAMKICRFAAGLIEEKDYEEWRYVCFDNDRVRLRDVISETECELLYRRCSRLWSALGHPECDWWDDKWEYFTSTYNGVGYYDLYVDRYSEFYEHPIGEWEREMEAEEAEQDTRRLFHDALPDDLPACSQDFTEYWHGGPQWEDFSWITYKHGQQQKYC